MKGGLNEAEENHPTTTMSGRRYDGTDDEPDDNTLCVERTKGRRLGWLWSLDQKEGMMIEGL